MRPKDPLPNMEKSAVVYRIDCMDCPSNYVGETSKRVKTRVHEHRLAVRRGEQRSQVWAHMAESGHRFNFNEISVLASDNTKGGRLLKEAWLSNRDSINRHIDLCPAHLALRSWSAGAHPSRCRQLSEVFSIPKRETRKEMLTPQQVTDNLTKEEQHLKSAIIPTVCTRLQKIRQVTRTETWNDNIENTQDTPAMTLVNTMNREGGKQSETVITYPHPEMEKMNSGTLEKLPNLTRANRLELPTRSELSGVQDDLVQDDRQIGKVGDEAENRPWRENTCRDRTHSSLKNTPPHSVTSIPVDSGEPRCKRIRTRGAGRKEERRTGSECGVSQEDRRLPPPYPDVNGVWKDRVDGNTRKMRSEQEKGYGNYGDPMSWSPHPTVLIGGACGRDTQDPPRSCNKRAESPRERDDICRNDSWAGTDWRKKKGEYELSERMVQTGEEDEDGESTKKKKGALSNSKPDEGGTSNIVCTSKRRKKEKLATGSQSTQLGPVTRSRSRAQNLINL